MSCAETGDDAVIMDVLLLIYRLRKNGMCLPCTCTYSAVCPCAHIHCIVYLAEDLKTADDDWLRRGDKLRA